MNDLKYYNTHIAFAYGVKHNYVTLSKDAYSLIDCVEVNRSTISKVETGKFAITIDYLVKFAWYLDFEFNVLKKQVQ